MIWSIGTMLAFRCAMIHTDPPTTRNTTNNPKASASTCWCCRAGRDVQEEDQMHAHLRDRQHDQGDGDGGLPDQVGAAMKNDVAVSSSASTSPTT